MKSLTAQWLGRVSYDEGLAIQERAVAAIRAGTDGSTLLLLEHDPVFTIGRTRDRSSLVADAQLPHPVRETNRGGQATYHGPGQLVGYPILDLHEHGQDVHRYLRFLEDVLIEMLATHGIEAARRESLTGVWVHDRKIASIGVGVRHWITMHGFALNVRGALDGFQSIIPCGISGVEMTSIERESGADISVESVAAAVADVFQRMLPQLAGGKLQP